MRSSGMKPAKINLNGVRKGLLTITRRAPDIIGKNNTHKEMWYADCDCGTKDCLVSACDYKRNRIKSCGCLKKNKHIGEKYGRLTITKQVCPTNNKGTKCYCDCDCGSKNTLVYLSNLKSGYTKSCGCLKSERTSERCRKENQYINKGSYYVGTTASGVEFYFDIEDFEKVKKYCWHEDKQGRIVANTHSNDDIKKGIKIHRLIMNVKDDNLVVDHINHDQSDNRRNNLRIVTKSQNLMNLSLKSNNTSGYPGVCWNKNKNKWVVRITENGNVHNLGYYISFDDAVKTRKEAEEKYFGKYSYKNSTGKCVNDGKI